MKNLAAGLSRADPRRKECIGEEIKKWETTSSSEKKPGNIPTPLFIETASSKTHGFIHKNDLEIVYVIWLFQQDQQSGAHSPLRLTIDARTGFHTGVLFLFANHIHNGRSISRTSDRIIRRIHEFIETGYGHDSFGPGAKTGDPVSAAVEVHHDSIPGDGVDPAQEHIDLPVDSFQFQSAGRTASILPMVEDRIPLFPYPLDDAELFPQGYGTSDSHGFIRTDLLHNKMRRIGFILKKIRVILLAFQRLQYLWHSGSKIHFFHMIRIFHRPPLYQNTGSSFRPPGIPLAAYPKAPFNPAPGRAIPEENESFVAAKE